MRLCLVIPSYQDCTRLRAYLPELCEQLADIRGVSILVVDDGSGSPAAEETGNFVRELARSQANLLEPLLLEANHGKGGAVYAGWDAAPESEWLGFVDADGATPAQEVVRLVREALADPEAADVYVGSRIKMLGRTVSRSVKRHIVGRAFATLSAVVTGFSVYDSQCGCKLVRREFYRQVREHLVEARFAFDIDLLTNLALAGAKMREFPVDWSDIPGSKVSLTKDGLQMAQAIWRLRDRLKQRGV
jgi:glycosyltransferase involved in cell wall biosynthesis